MLEIQATNKGVLIPRVALTSYTDNVTIANPATSLLVYSQGGGIPNGYYYNAGTSAAPQWVRLIHHRDAWLLTGNSETTPDTHFIGTVDDQHLIFKTNNTERMRVKNTGDFIVGGTDPGIAGDLFSVIGLTSFPWAVNGYTSQSGGGVYGWRSTGAADDWGAIQGEQSNDQTREAAVAGVYGATSGRGVIGQKQAGGLGWGGLFLNDLGYTGYFGSASDERIKKNIQPISDALSKILKLQGYTYQFKEPYAEFLGGDDTYYGFMAQNVESIFPELVKMKSFTPNNTRSFKTNVVEINVKSVSTISLIPVLVEAMKEQQKQIEDLKIQINKLYEEIESLKSK